ncbi:hypothetical protein MMC18_006193 [Xylographa bjoerkii]|nr:hypothetical protein [Xylographa bjoerkii]
MKSDVYNHTPDGAPDSKQSSKPTPKPISPTCNTCAKSQASLPLPQSAVENATKRSTAPTSARKADWNTHKKICNQASAVPQAQPIFAMNSMIQMMTLTGGPDSNSFAKIGDGTYLDGLPEKDAFAQIIDSYRLRMEDEYKFRGDAGGLYAGENPLPDFRRYLNRAEKKGVVLPKWWSGEKRKASEKTAVDRAKWSDLHSAVEKVDIIEHYRDSMMPMKLRMLAEKVEGSNVTSM